MIIVYGSRYGAAKRYAEKLADMAGAAAIPFEDVSALRAAFEGTDKITFVYIGGVYAGIVRGLKKTARRLPAGKIDRLVVLAVGFAAAEDARYAENLTASVVAQFPPSLRERLSVFHLRGGIDYEKLSPAHRFLIKLMYLAGRGTPPEKQGAELRVVAEIYKKQVDRVDFTALLPIYSTYCAPGNGGQKDGGRGNARL